MKQAQAGNARVVTGGSSQNVMITRLPKRVYREAIPYPELKFTGQNWLYPVLFLAAGFIVVGFMAFFALIAKHPAFASIVSNISAPIPTQENLWASVDIAKPAITPIDVSAFAPGSAVKDPYTGKIFLVP